MTPTDPIACEVASNPDLSDKELARVLKVGTRRVAAVRQSLGIPPHRPTKTLDANVWLRVPQATRTAVEALASAEGVTMSAWCASAIVERMERVQGRMQRLHLPPTFKVGDRVRWVGVSPEGWDTDWGHAGDVGEVLDLWGDSLHIRWDRDLARMHYGSTWSIHKTNLAPETDYIGSP